MIKHDPIEEKEENKEIFEKVDKEVKEMLKKQGVEHTLGYIHVFNTNKKRILKEKYNIEWKTLEEMNPHISMD